MQRDGRRERCPSFAARLVAWQREHGRHDLPWQRTRDPYRIWLSEVMLQQTQVATVLPYYERFLASFPDVARARARADRRRARALERPRLLPPRASSARRRTRRSSSEHRRRVSARCGALATLPGIGRSTAAAIAAFAYGDARRDPRRQRQARARAPSRRSTGCPGRAEGRERDCGARPKRLLPDADIEALHAGHDGSRRDGVHAHAGVLAVPGARGLRRAHRGSHRRAAGTATGEGRFRTREVRVL